MLVLIYALLASLMALTVAKSGSNVNYFVELMAVCATLLGIVARNSVEAAFGARRNMGKRVWSHPVFLPLMIGIQALIINHAVLRDQPLVRSNDQSEQLQAVVRAADRPIISDNMVMLVRSGVPVVWEPAIFAELAKTGAWDEAPFVARIKAREFAFFITAGPRGSTFFDSRYNPAVADAMDVSYPVKRKIAGYTLHLPAEPLPKAPEADRRVPQLPRGGTSDEGTTLRAGD
jgi:hypothetical protein